MLQKLSLLFVGSILLTSSNPLFSSPIVGSYNYTSYYDMNINDGVVLEQTPGSLTVTEGSAPNEFNFVDNSALGVLSGTIIQDGDIAIFPESHYDLGAENLMEYFVISNGISTGSVQVRQSNTDPLDISFSVATWQRSISPFTIDDMVGEWSLSSMRKDNNLRNTTDEFETSTGDGSLYVTKVNDSVLTFHWDTFALDLLVFGNLAYLDTPVISVDGHHHLLGFLFDEEGVLFYQITTEFDDPTDVSIGMALGTKTSTSVPEPSSLILLTMGLIGLFGFNTRKL